jgi:hypothetical protein
LTKSTFDRATEISVDPISPLQVTETDCEVPTVVRLRVAFPLATLLKLPAGLLQTQAETSPPVTVYKTVAVVYISTVAIAGLTVNFDGGVGAVELLPQALITSASATAASNALTRTPGLLF